MNHGFGGSVRVANMDSMASHLSLRETAAVCLQSASVCVSASLYIQQTAGHRAERRSNEDIVSSAIVSSCNRRPEPEVASRLGATPADRDISGDWKIVAPTHCLQAILPMLKMRPQTTLYEQKLMWLCRVMTPFWQHCYKTHTFGTCQQRITLWNSANPGLHKQRARYQYIRMQRTDEWVYNIYNGAKLYRTAIKPI